MRKIGVIIFGIICVVFLACEEKEFEFRSCDALLSPCTGNLNGEYCLFGYKWGESPQFEPNGLETDGPKISGGLITYSFQTKKQRISIHNRQEVKTKEFDSKGSCAREKVIAAFKEYEKYANLTFKQEKDDENSDIRFYVTRDGYTAVGNPNYQDELCSEIAGIIVFNKGKIDDCDEFQQIALHEIGHALGMGHVTSRNVMNSNIHVFGKMKGLQSGDIKGVVSIYGEK